MNIQQTINHFMPLPYNRVSVQNYEGSLDITALKLFFEGKACYFRTDFLVLRQKSRYLVAKIKTSKVDPIFSKIESIEIISGLEKTHFVENLNVDVANRTAMAILFRKMKFKEDEIMVVRGRFEHINFIRGSGMIDLTLDDNVPPESRLESLVRQVLDTTELPPVNLVANYLDLQALTNKIRTSCALLPCEYGSAKLEQETAFLDQHPEFREWSLIGCDRSLEIHNVFYKQSPREHLNTCPLKRGSSSASWRIRRCCKLSNEFLVQEKTLTVAWGSEFKTIQSGLLAFFSQVEFINE